MAISKRPPRTARNVLMELLARRDHSEKELRQKLKLRKFAIEDIEKALVYAYEYNWIGESTKLAETLAKALHRRGKGINSINNSLIKKGLPKVAMNLGLEYEKALALVATKRRSKKFADVSDSKIRASLGRFLQSRGFPQQIIRKVLLELRVAT